jgi:hypothetical protein
MMKIAAVSLAMILLCTNACAKGKQQAQGPPRSSTEQEIRAALCDLDKGDYASAQKRMERVLQSDSKSIYAEKVLLFSLSSQIKPGDKSAESIALIRKAIEACQQAMNNPQFTPEEKSRMDSPSAQYWPREAVRPSQREPSGRTLPESSKVHRDNSH